MSWLWLLERLDGSALEAGFQVLDFENDLLVQFLGERPNTTILLLNAPKDVHGVSTGLQPYEYVSHVAESRNGLIQLVEEVARRTGDEVPLGTIQLAAMNPGCGNILASTTAPGVKVGH